MDISVIIPAYNYARYLGRAIESVMAQQGGAFELIVIDDGSSDNTPEVLEQYRQRYGARMRCRRQENAGPCAARNQGLDLAVGDFVLFLDADDRLHPQGLSRLLAEARRYPEADLIIGGYSVDNGRQVSNRSNHSLPATRAARLRAALNNRIVICNGCFMVRRRAMREIRFPERLRNMEDPVLRSLLFANLEVASFSEPVMTCYRHAGSLRYDAGTVAEAADLAVSALFDHPKMPPEFQHLRRDFQADQYLGVYRRLVDAGRVREAGHYYQLALQVRPAKALRFTYLSKLLRGWWKNRKARLG